MHASVILGLLLCFAYSLVSFLNYLTIKKTEWVKKTKILGIYGLALSLITVLPPQGFAQYQILWSFVKYRDLVTRVISEWVPLWNYAAPFALYSCFTAIILFIFIFVLVKKKMFKKTVWLYPLLVLIPYGYLAIRNMYYGYFALSILFGWILSQINFNSVKKSIKITFSLGFILLLVFLGRWMMQDDLNNKQDFPDHAADFIQEENIQGNMFNQFGYGSYLEYRLYPEHKALVDEKDFFVTLPDYYNLQSSLSASPGYAASFISFLQKYDISYAVLFVKNDPSGQIFSNILINNPNWSLVFWDDNTEIFIKKDGKNSDLITKFGTKSISPFGDSPSKVGLEKQAYDEYVRMVKTQDSALSRTIMGYLLQKQGALSQAEEEFQKAIQLNNSYVSAYISLAMLRANQGQVQSAIDLFEKALKINPNQTEVYMYLGNLYESIHDTQSELDILNQGASHASDENQIQYFQQKIQTLSK
jgi:tetratricopeptide (TPR) repeat protein